MPKIIIASGPVIVLDNKLILDKHGKDTFWKFCGGRIESLNSETLVEVAIREAWEELGVKIRIIDERPFIMTFKKETAGQEADLILVHYLAELLPGEEIVPGSDIREVRWLNLADLGKEDLAPNIRPALRHFGFI